jgi:hypothetical protein
MPSEAVKVMVRVRPMNEKEITRQCKIIIDVDDKNNAMTLRKDSKLFFQYLDDLEANKMFTFDFVFSPSVS